MAQCTAFTKSRIRCKKKALEETQAQTVCQYHQDYYDDWFKSHPAPNGWRLNIEEKGEYMFQIENGHVKITDEYLKTFNDPYQSDYYEYLLHLPHIDIDSNMNMWIHLMFSFLKQFDSIQIDEANINYFFGNMFQNRAFNPPTFAMRLIYIIDRQRQQVLSNLSEARINAIFSAVLDHPKFKSMLYMNWEEEMSKLLGKNDHLPIFLGLLRERKTSWRAKENPLKKEIQEVAMLPDRVVDWYLDCEKRKEIAHIMYV